MNGVKPHAYIADVIAMIASDWPAARWGEPMPLNLKPVGAPQLTKAALPAVGRPHLRVFVGCQRTANREP
jgi:hypothetical protein